MILVSTQGPVNEKILGWLNAFKLKVAFGRTLEVGTYSTNDLSEMANSNKVFIVNYLFVDFEKLDALNIPFYMAGFKEDDRLGWYTAYNNYNNHLYSAIGVKYLDIVYFNKLQLKNMKSFITIDLIARKPPKEIKLLVDSVRNSDTLETIFY